MRVGTRTNCGNWISGVSVRVVAVVSGAEYRRRSRIEIMFGRLKDWSRVVARYDRCPTLFFSAIVLAGTVIFWL